MDYPAQMRVMKWLFGCASATLLSVCVVSALCLAILAR
jgi:hypothetical protein